MDFRNLKKDFVDINLDEDTRLFVNPYLFNKGTDMYVKKAKVIYDDFCWSLQDMCRNGNVVGIEETLSYLHEFQYTRLWYATPQNTWKWNGKERTEHLVNEITNTWLEYIVTRGVHFADFFWIIDNVSSDCLSDAISNIVASVLIDFTQSKVLEAWLTPKEMKQEKIAYWNLEKSSWDYKTVLLPIDEYGKAFLFTPKSMVSSSYHLSPERMLDRWILEYDNLQDLLWKMWITIELWEDVKKLTKKERRDKIKKLKIPTKELLRRFFVTSTREFAQAKRKVIQRTKSLASQIWIPVKGFSVTLSKDEFVNIVEENA